MIENLVVRRIQDHDIEAVARLWHQLSLHHEPFHSYYSVKNDGEEQLLAHVHDLMSRECIFFVAELEAQICGFISGYIVRRNPQLTVDRVGKVDNIFVAQDKRGKHIGTKLIESLCEYFTRQGVKYIEISCDVQNPDALRLYKRLGFVEQKMLLVKED
jgi:ribosomal protein S18 acetylase RimI-like enzyme